MTEEFLAQYYSAAPAVPRLVVVGPQLRERAELLAEALSAQRGGPVEVRVAERGTKRRLRELAERNAVLALAQDKLRQERRRAQRVDALSALQDALGLESLPVRIEGFDISNLGAEHTVASMVVFRGGAPLKSDYRRFRIRGDRTAGPDDFSSMEEVLARRVSQLLEQSDRSPHDAERDESFAVGPRPDRDRRRQGPALGRDAGAGAAGRAGHGGDRAREAARGGLRPRALGAARDPGRLRGAAAAAAGPRRGAPVRARPPPQPARARR